MINLFPIDLASKFFTQNAKTKTDINVRFEHASGGVPKEIARFSKKKIDRFDQKVILRVDLITLLIIA